MFCSIHSDYYSFLCVYSYTLSYTTSSIISDLLILLLTLTLISHLSTTTPSHYTCRLGSLVAGVFTGSSGLCSLKIMASQKFSNLRENLTYTDGRNSDSGLSVSTYSLTFMHMKT